MIFYCSHQPSLLSLFLKMRTWSRFQKWSVARRKEKKWQLFWISLFQERYFSINFIFTLIFSFILIQDYEALKILILLTIASVNTPLTTLISLIRFDRSCQVPKSRFILMYYRVLLTYFLSVNLFVALFIKNGGHAWLGDPIFTRSDDSSSSGSCFALTYWNLFPLRNGI